MSLRDLVEIHGDFSAHQLPELPYDYGDLEPHIDEETMREHHLKHQKKYVDTLNEEIDGTPASQRTLEEILGDIRAYSKTIRNNGGGVWNHTFFWPLLSPQKIEPSGPLVMSISKQWGNLQDFKEEFKEKGLKQFGSGWVWLVVDNTEQKLKIITTSNQDNPLMYPNTMYTPIIGCDLWEHAYYLKHKSNRGEWIDTFFEILNWEQANKNYK
jgi:Fe-Mn family superoxide dismutase